MRQFDFYEFTGILAPGGVLVSGILLIIPDANTLLESNGISFGEFGLLLLVAYAFGHLIQSVGNAVEWAWWKLFGGMPTDWIRSGKRDIISKPQAHLLKEKISSQLDLDLPDKLSDLTAKEWYSIVRQIHTVIDKEGLTQRVEIFNGNYGINRGLAASFLALVIIGFLMGNDLDWQSYAILGVLLSFALLRMHRFGVHYGRELMIKFLASKGGSDV